MTDKEVQDLWVLVRFANKSLALDMKRLIIKLLEERATYYENGGWIGEKFTPSDRSMKQARRDFGIEEEEWKKTLTPAEMWERVT